MASVSGSFGDHSKSSVDDEDDDRDHTSQQTRTDTRQNYAIDSRHRQPLSDSEPTEVSGKLNTVCPQTDADAAAAGPREPGGSTNGQKDRQVDANSVDVKLAPTTVWILGPDWEGEGPRREHHSLFS